MNTWFMVRAGLVGAAFVLAALSTQALAPVGGASVPMLLAVFAFGIVGMLFIVGVQRLNPRSARVWRYPNWSINPFVLREPLQFFHLGGFFFLAGGAGSALGQLFRGQALGLASLFLPAFGAGILIGVYACTFVYRAKMESHDHSAFSAAKRHAP
jgi:hypothetical protein